MKIEYQTVEIESYIWSNLIVVFSVLSALGAVAGVASGHLIPAEAGVITSCVAFSWVANIFFLTPRENEDPIFYNPTIAFLSMSGLFSVGFGTLLVGGAYLVNGSTLLYTTVGTLIFVTYVTMLGFVSSVAANEHKPFMAFAFIPAKIIESIRKDRE